MRLPLLFPLETQPACVARVFEQAQRQLRIDLPLARQARVDFARGVAERVFGVDVFHERLDRGISIARGFKEKRIAVIPADAEVGAAVKYPRPAA